MYTYNTNVKNNFNQIFSLDYEFNIFIQSKTRETKIALVIYNVDGGTRESPLALRQ